MAYVPFAVEYNCRYMMVGPGLSPVAVFNDPTDAAYVGMITEITGLDSPEVRESAEDLVEADGGSHGAFYFGRRPFTITARIFGHSTPEERATRIDRARRASLATQGDAYLFWTPTVPGGESLQLLFRRQQPFRESGGWVKEIQMALVSESAVIQSQTQYATPSTASGTTIAAENKGSYVSFPIIEITGVSVNPIIAGGGGTLITGPSGTPLNLASGETIQIDTLNHTAKFIGGARNGQSGNRYIDFASTTWPRLRAATTETFGLIGGGTMVIRWRHSWV